MQHLHFLDIRRRHRSRNVDRTDRKSSRSQHETQFHTRVLPFGFVSCRTRSGTVSRGLFWRLLNFIVWRCRYLRVGLEYRLRRERFWRGLKRPPRSRRYFGLSISPLDIEIDRYLASCTRSLLRRQGDPQRPDSVLAGSGRRAPTARGVAKKADRSLVEAFVANRELLLAVLGT